MPAGQRRLPGDHASPGRRCCARSTATRERYREAVLERVPGIYFTGDGARRDEDGYFWIMGRVDDVMNVAGHRLGTMEIESALVDHPSVAEAAVVGKTARDQGPGDRRVRHPEGRARSRRRRAAGGAEAARGARRSAPSPGPTRSSSPPSCRRPAAARSCAACCATSPRAAPWATPPRWPTRRRRRAAGPLRGKRRSAVKIHEYQAKEILRRYGVPTLAGRGRDNARGGGASGAASWTSQWSS